MKSTIALLVAVLTSVSSPAVELTGMSNPAGQTLAAELRNLAPEENSEITGVLKIRADKKKLDVPVQARVLAHDGKWKTVYTGSGVDGVPGFQVVIVHSVNAPNEYLLAEAKNVGTPQLEPIRLANGKADEVFLAGSDFSIADLGLDFLHWPEQKRLQATQLRLGRDCYLLESQNPAAGEMVRVVSYIDKETNGLLAADGYNAKGERVKKFSLSGSSFKKINGQWQLEKMTIDSPKRKSQTVLQFDLEKP
jgi:hypothetical protein